MKWMPLLAVAALWGALSVPLHGEAQDIAPPANAPVAAPTPPAAVAPAPTAPATAYVPSAYGGETSYASPPSRRPRISRGMLITGLSMFGGSYALSAFVGLVGLQHDSSDCVDCEETAPLMFIPVLGPFLAIGPAAGGEALLAVLGAVQLVGAGLTIGGAVQIKRQRAAHGLSWQLPHDRRLSIDAGMSPSASVAKLRLSF